MVLETSVVVVEEISVGMATSIMGDGRDGVGGSYRGEGCGGRGWLIMNSVMMEAVSEVAEATVIWAITTIALQILDLR